MSELLTFRAGGTLWAVPLASVQEVVRVLRVTPLPLTPNAVAGIIDLHGSTVLAIDFGALSGTPSCAPGSAIVLHDAALLVESVRDVIQADSIDAPANARFAWADGMAADATVVNPGRLLEAIE